MSKKAQHTEAFRPHDSAHISFEELAAQQGVVPIADFDNLLGKPVAGDESAEEFSAMLREWRREGTALDAPR